MSTFTPVYKRRQHMTKLISVSINLLEEFLKYLKGVSFITTKGSPGIWGEHNILGDNKGEQKTTFLLKETEK